MESAQAVIEAWDTDARIKDAEERIRAASTPGGRRSAEKDLALFLRVKSALGFNPAKEMYEDGKESIVDFRRPANGKKDRLANPNRYDIDARILRKNPTNPSIIRWQEVVKAWKGVTTESKREADKYMGEAAKGWRPNYFPSRLSKNAKLLIAKHSEARDAFIGHVAEKLLTAKDEDGNVKYKTPAEALERATQITTNEVSGVGQDGLSRPKGSGLEYSRSDLFPAWSLESRLTLVQEEMHDVGRTIAQYKWLAPHVRPDGSVPEVDTITGKLVDTMDKETVEKLRKEGERSGKKRIVEWTPEVGAGFLADAVGRESRDSDMRKKTMDLFERSGLFVRGMGFGEQRFRQFFNTLATLQVAKFLNTPQAIVQNLWSPFTLGAVHSTKSLLAPLQYRLDPAFKKEYDRLAKLAGIGGEINMLEDMYVDHAGRSGGKIEAAITQMARWAMKFPHPRLSFSATQLLSETWAGMVAKSHMDELLAEIISKGRYGSEVAAERRAYGVEPHAVKKARQTLKRLFLLEAADIEAAASSGKWRDADYARGIFRAALLMRAGANPFNLPEVISGAGLSPIRVFTTYPANYMREFAQAIQKDQRSAIRMLVMAGAAGYGLKELEKWLSEILGSEREEAADYYTTATKRVLGNVMGNMASVGLATFLADPSSAMSVANLAGGVHAGTLGDVVHYGIRNLSRFADGRQFADSTLELLRKQAGLFRIASNIHRRYGKGLPAIMDEAEQVTRIYRQQQGEGNVILRSAKLAADRGMQSNNLIAPELRQIEMAVQQGDAVKASEWMGRAMERSMALKHAKRAKKDQDEALKKAYDGIRQSIMMRSPLGGLSTSMDLDDPDVTDRFDEFAEWLEKSHPGDFAKYDDAHRAYVATAEAVLEGYEP